jgi:hypothetical protein
LTFYKISHKNLLENFLNVKFESLSMKKNFECAKNGIHWV